MNKLRNVILMILLIITLASCSTVNDNQLDDTSQDDVYYYGFNVDRENLDERLLLYDTIAIIKVLEIVETIQDTESNPDRGYHDIPFTHLKFEVLYTFKSDLNTDDIVDVILLAGYNESNDYIYSNNFINIDFDVEYSPQVGDTLFVFLTTTPSILPVGEPRIFLDSYLLGPDTLDITVLPNYIENGDIQDQHNDIKDLIKDIEERIKELETDS